MEMNREKNFPDTKNRFDEKHPFDVVRAEDFGEDLYEFYNPIEKLIRRVSGVEITGSRPVFLIGGRGTGKTMFLKFQDFEMQINNYIYGKFGPSFDKNNLTCSQMKEFLLHKKFIGVYTRFKTTEYDAMAKDLAPFFEPYLAMKIAQRLFSVLKQLKKCDLIPKPAEKEVVNFFKDQMKEPITPELDSIEDALELIKQTIVSYELIEKKYAYYSIEEIKKAHTIPIIIYQKIFFELPNLIFENIECLRGKKLFVLLDELEYLDDYKASCIGALIKNSDETVVIFKIGSRYMRKKVNIGQSAEVLQEPHDFRIINITDALNRANSGRKNDYSQLIKDILNKRLAKSEFFRQRGITKIEELYPNLPMDEEARILVFGRQKHWERFRQNLKTAVSQKRVDEIIKTLSYPNNPIIEKLNMLLYYRGKKPEAIREMFIEYQNGNNKKYARLYEKNALNLLFQLYNDYGANKNYSGIDIFINLSSGIIRNAIEICNQALNTAYNYGYELQNGKQIDIQHQDKGAKIEARLQFDDIQRIPGFHMKTGSSAESAATYGMEVQDFINQIGTLFRALQLDKYLVEPEQTHFETDYLSLNNYSRELIDMALRFSYLQEKSPMKPKDVKEPKKRDYVLNRIFAPEFYISYRVRGRTYILPHQIDQLISSRDPKIKKQILSEILAQNTKKRSELLRDIGRQKTLFNVEAQE